MVLDLTLIHQILFLEFLFTFNYRGKRTKKRGFTEASLFFIIINIIIGLRLLFIDIKYEKKDFVLKYKTVISAFTFISKTLT